MYKVPGAEGKYSNYMATNYLKMEDTANRFKRSFESRWECAASYWQFSMLYYSRQGTE